MQRKKAKSKRRFRLKTPAEEARIQAGIKSDPDCPELAPGQLVRTRPFREWQAERRLGRPKSAVHKEPVTVRLKLAPFDASEFLDNETVIAEYLALALKDPDPDMFLVAVANVAKARGLSQVAKDSGLGREGLYKALKPGSKIRYETVRRLVDSLGVHLTVKAT